MIAYARHQLNGEQRMAAEVAEEVIVNADVRNAQEALPECRQATLDRRAWRHVGNRFTCLHLRWTREGGTINFAVREERQFPERNERHGDHRTWQLAGEALTNPAWWERLFPAPPKGRDHKPTAGDLTPRRKRCSTRCPRGRSGLL